MRILQNWRMSWLISLSVFNPRNLRNPHNPRFRQLSLRWGYVGSLVLGFTVSVQPHLRVVDIRRGEVPSPDGLRDPTLTDSGCEGSVVFNPRNLRNPLNPRFRQLSLRWVYVGSLVLGFSFPFNPTYGLVNGPKLTTLLSRCESRPTGVMAYGGYGTRSVPTTIGGS